VTGKILYTRLAITRSPTGVETKNGSEGVSRLTPKITAIKRVTKVRVALGSNTTKYLKKDSKRTSDHIKRIFLVLGSLKSIEPVLALSATCTRRVTLLSWVNFRYCWSCRLSPSIVTFLTLPSRRAILHPMTRLATLKTSFPACKTLAWMVLTTLWTSWVGPIS